MIWYWFCHIGNISIVVNFSQCFYWWMFSYLLNCTPNYMLRLARSPWLRNNFHSMRVARKILRQTISILLLFKIQYFLTSQWGRFYLANLPDNIVPFLIPPPICPSTQEFTFKYCCTLIKHGIKINDRTWPYKKNMNSGNSLKFVICVFDA